ncbi:Rho termination factor N-terminal domain-containing protein [Mycoplasma todarodis]|uniref:Rho termination factor-like N-terminal domain-containing protein n=1 Tax=Mycoplasma todarodis TaxID=1937191 RepID=A0A4V2NI13_9MOLU|nr:Rho termination factor N-terminal domain-containing protein [Mycoplasma todarodis]TCG11098.1 hypothetical protein C4B25_02290 [Mycoplasma todarodis]
MNPFFQANTPTTKEMWKNEPNKFRHWIILFGIAMAIFLVMTIAGLALVLSDKSTLQDSLSKAIAGTKGFTGDADQWASRRILMSFIVMPIIMICMAIAGAVLYGMTLVKSYKNKTFARISAAAVYLPEIVGLFSLFNAAFSSWSMISIVDNHVGAILSITSQWFAVILLIFAMQVSRIRKTFIHIERMEELKKSPEFQQMQEQMKNFFNAAQSGQSPSAAYGPTPTPNAQSADIKETPVETQEAPEVVELKKLKIEELREIANKLSISGATKMSKDELVATIVRVTNEG